MRIHLLILLCLAPLSLFSQSDFQRIRDNIYFKKQATVTNEAYLNSKALSYSNTLDTTGRWPDVDYVSRSQTGWPALNHLSRIMDMTVAYTRENGALHNNDSVYNAIVSALTNWRDYTNTSTNWYYNQISAPQSIGMILVLMRKGARQLPAELEWKLYTYKMPGTPYKHVGTNQVLVATHWIYRASLIERPTLMDSSVTKLLESVVLMNVGKMGLQYDYSFQFHGKQLYIDNYGTHFMSQIYDSALDLVGTAYAVSKEKLDLVSKFCKEAVLRGIRGRYIDFSLPGRQIGSPGSLGGMRIVNHLRKAKAVDPGNNTTWDAAIARISGTQTSSYQVESSHTHYWISDYTQHSRPEYMFNVRMVSSRTVRTEQGNNENRKGKFLPDGATNIQRRGDEYANIIAVWDWSKIPGITCRNLTESSALLGAEGEPRGNGTLTGGVSDGKYGASCYELTFNNVNARKSWFFFDKEVVCLGAGIASTAEENIFSTVNQAILKGNVTVKTNGQAGTLTPESAEVVSNPQWILQDSVGYFFPSGGTVNISNKTQTGRLKDVSIAYGDTITKRIPVFKTWFDHGVAPTGGSYAYIVAPGLNNEAAMNSYKPDNIRILNNTSSIQAVKNEELKQIQAVFYQAGTLTDSTSGFRIEVSGPSAVLIKNVGSSKVSVTISDPSQSATMVTVKTRFSENGPIGSTSVNLPQGNFKGSSVSLELEAIVSTNLALNKPASQSTTAYNGAASRAVDGNTNGAWSSATVTHTSENEATPSWWEVDLGAVAYIETIDVFNRTDGCCKNRLSNYVVLVSDVPFDQAPAGTVSSFPQTTVAASPTTVTIGKVGRYVRIRQTSAKVELSIAEVRVNGYWVTLENLAFGKPASQSSTASGGSAPRAVDGNTNGNWSAGSVTHTSGTETNPWWEVDLGASAKVSSVEVYNRTDCCGNRLSDYRIIVSDSSLAGGISSSVFDSRQTGIAGSPTTVGVNRTGRYIRIIQGTANTPLSLAEVRVIGTWNDRDQSAARIGVGPLTKEEEPLSEQFIVSPNPASDQIVVTASGAVTTGRDSQNDRIQIEEVVIVNNLGTQVKRMKPGKVKELTIRLQGLQEGSYVIRIFDGKKWHSKKLLIGR